MDAKSLYLTYKNNLSAKQKQVDALSSKVDNLIAEVEKLQDAVKLSELCLSEQAAFKVYIEDIVQAIFIEVYNEEDYAEWQFCIKETFKADGVTFAGFKFCFDTPNGVVDLVESQGSAMSGVISFALVVAFLLLSPTLSKVMILDEVFEHMSRKRHQRLMNLLEDIQKDIPIQFISATHEEIESKLQFNVDKANGRAVVTT